MPTTVRHGPGFEPPAVCSTSRTRRPTALPSGHSRLASVSLITATGASVDASCAVNSRPWRMWMPSVEKYPALTEMAPALVPASRSSVWIRCVGGGTNGGQLLKTTVDPVASDTRPANRSWNRRYAAASG